MVPAVVEFAVRAKIPPEPVYAPVCVMLTNPLLIALVPEAVTTIAEPLVTPAPAATFNIVPVVMPVPLTVNTVPVVIAFPVTVVPPVKYAELLPIVIPLA